MRSGLRIYARLFAAGFRQQSTYRLAALGGLVANATFGFLKVAMLVATVHAAGGTLRGYDRDSIVSYVWLSQGVLGSINLFGRNELAGRIKDGSVAVDFLRPLSVQGATITTEVGAAVFSLLPRGVPSVLIGVLASGLVLPTTGGPWILGGASLFLGIVISFCTVYLISVAGFWLIETRGIQILYMVLSGFFAGLFVPLALFPPWLRMLSAATPFPSMLMYPIQVLSGHVTGLAAARLLTAQVGWLATTVLIGAVLTRSGRQRLEVQGG